MSKNVTDLVVAIFPRQFLWDLVLAAGERNQKAYGVFAAYGGGAHSIEVRTELEQGQKGKIEKQNNGHRVFYLPKTEMQIDHEEKQGVHSYTTEDVLFLLRETIEKLAKTPEKAVEQTNERDARSVHGYLDATAAKRVRREGVEPMSKTTIENAENVSPIFEGTLGRDAMAEALKLVRKETGLSQRDAAKAVGTTNADIGRIETGKATLDKSAEVLAELGYKMNIQLVPIGKS